MPLRLRWLRRIGVRALSRRNWNHGIEQLEPRCVLTHWGSPAVPAFSSLPGANHTVYLDFNGHVTEGTAWNNYDFDGNSATPTNPSIDSPPYDIDGNPSAFSATELARIEEAWKRVSEDFIPFNLNVTTVDPGIEALRKSGSGDAQWGIRVVITADTEGSGAGGIAYIDSFNWSSDTPCWVYNTSTIGVAEAASHEVGHSLGLSHDGTSTASYYTGHGSGETDWAPIMGVGYYANITQWDRGEYFGTNNGGSGANYGKGPDDLAIITSYNGFGYRTDDHGNSTFAASPLGVSGVSVSGAGTIERSTDSDYFTFTTGAGNVTLNLAPFVPGPNLDIKADLYNSAGTLVASSNPTASLSANFSLTLAAGQYYLSVDGVGVGNPANDPPTGYSDYASIGRYAITGTVVDPGALPQLSINDVTVNETVGTATFTVTVSGTVNDPVTVNFATANGSATQPGDYLATSGSLMFVAGGSTTQTIVVSIVDNLTAEGTENFFVNLSSAVGATLSDSQGQGTIQDNDVAPFISIVAASANKNEGTGASDTPFTFTVSRTGSTSGTASVQFSVSGVGSSKNAASASDFTGSAFPSGTVSFAAGEASKTLTISVKADSTKESNEKFRVTLSNVSGAALGTNTADGTIVNDDGGRASGAPAGATLDDGSPLRDSELKPLAIRDSVEMFEGPQAHHDHSHEFDSHHTDSGLTTDFVASFAMSTTSPPSTSSRLRASSRIDEQPQSTRRLREAVDQISGLRAANSEKPTATTHVQASQSHSRAADDGLGLVDQLFATFLAWLEA